MNIEDIQKICTRFAGVTQDIKWENHLCFNVGGKMFMITSPETVPVSASFKTGSEMFEQLSVRPGCQPAPYLARYNWVHVDDLTRFTKKEWENLLAEAYKLVYEKLPAKTRALIGNKKS